MDDDFEFRIEGLKTRRDPSKSLEQQLAIRETEYAQVDRYLDEERAATDRLADDLNKEMMEHLETKKRLSAKLEQEKKEHQATKEHFLKRFAALMVVSPSSNSGMAAPKNLEVHRLASPAQPKLSTSTSSSSISIPSSMTRGSLDKKSESEILKIRERQNEQLMNQLKVMSNKLEHERQNRAGLEQAAERLEILEQRLPELVRDTVWDESPKLNDKIRGAVQRVFLQWQTSNFQYGGSIVSASSKATEISDYDSDSESIVDVPRSGLSRPHGKNVMKSTPQTPRAPDPSENEVPLSKEDFDFLRRDRSPPHSPFRSRTSNVIGGNGKYRIRPLPSPMRRSGPKAASKDQLFENQHKEPEVFVDHGKAGSDWKWSVKDLGSCSSKKKWASTPELANSGLPPFIQDLIIEADQKTNGKHRAVAMSAAPSNLKKAAYLSGKCWMTTQHPIRENRPHERAITDFWTSKNDSECSMCRQRRAYGDASACFYFQSTTSIMLFGPPVDG